MSPFWMPMPLQSPNPSFQKTNWSICRPQNIASNNDCDNKPRVPSAHKSLNTQREQRTLYNNWWRRKHFNTFSQRLSSIIPWETPDWSPVFSSSSLSGASLHVFSVFQPHINSAFVTAALNYSSTEKKGSARIQRHLQSLCFRVRKDLGCKSVLPSFVPFFARNYVICKKIG